MFKINYLNLANNLHGFYTFYYLILTLLFSITIPNIICLVFLINLLIYSFKFLDYLKSWKVCVLALLLKIFITGFGLLLIQSQLFNQSMSQLLYYFYILELLSFFPLILMLNNEFTKITYEDVPKKSLDEALRLVKTNQGESIHELSFIGPVLLVFVRHFGCTFCRETVSTVSLLNNKIEEMNYNLVFVHMSDLDFGEQFFSNYFEKKVNHIADPSRHIYRAFGLKRGTLNQLFGFSTFINGLTAGIFKRHGIGSIEGDSLQLGGYFIFSKGQIIDSHPQKNASEKFNLNHFKTI